MSNPYLIPQIRVMQQQEKSSSYRCIDYISTSDDADFSCSDRRALCDWGYKAIAACHGVISRSTAVAAIGYFDRFLSSSAPRDTRILSDLPRIQLAFVACLVIALKADSGFHVESDFVSSTVCRNMYEAEEINAMEIEVLRALTWKLSGPTAHDFVDYFLEATPCLEGALKEIVQQFSKTLVELAVMKYDVAIRPPSEVAVVAICCALEYAGLGSARGLSFISISGLDLNDATLRSLFNTMIDIVVLEFLPGSEAAFERQRDDSENYSEASRRSPMCVSGPRDL